MTNNVPRQSGVYNPVTLGPRAPGDGNDENDWSGNFGTGWNRGSANSPPHR